MTGEIIQHHTIIFFMVKPDGIPHEATIRKMVAPLATVVADRLFDPADIQRIERLYSVHKNKLFYPWLLDYFREKPLRAYLLRARPDVSYNKGFYGDFLDLVGDTDPAKAEQGTIRSLSSDSLDKSVSEKRALRNMVHRSTTHEETISEAPLFFWDYIFDKSKISGEPGVLGRFLAQEGRGIFYDERVESGLKQYNLLSAVEELVCYQDYQGGKGDPLEQGRALAETRINGTRVIKEITLPSIIKTG